MTGFRGNGTGGKAVCLLLCICVLLIGCKAPQKNEAEPEAAVTQTKPTEQPTPFATDAPIAEPSALAPTTAPTQAPTPVPTSVPTPVPTSVPEPPEIADGSSFEVWFLDVGQGDAACILCDGHAMLIDGGDRGCSSLMYSFLRSHGIDRLDCIVATHPDADHVGGLSGAVQYAAAERVWCVADENSTDTFATFKRVLAEKGNTIEIPQAGEGFLLGSASVTVLYPEAGAIIDDNTSLAVRICYGETAFLFMGDCETEDEEILLRTCPDLSANVVKIAHHGSANSSGERFLERVNAAYAVISVGRDNGYGHPSEQVLRTLQGLDTVLYRTDLHGTIHCVSDGTSVTFDTEKNAGADSYGFAGTPEETPEHATAGEEFTYVVNTNTRKFHYSWCASVDQIKEKNRWNYTGTREWLIKNHYEPCKRCKP